MPAAALCSVAVPARPGWGAKGRARPRHTLGVRFLEKSFGEIRIICDDEQHRHQIIASWRSLPVFAGCGEGIAASFEFGFILRTDHEELRSSEVLVMDLGKYSWRGWQALDHFPLRRQDADFSRARRGSGAARWTTPFLQRGYLGARRAITYAPPQRDRHRLARPPRRSTCGSAVSFFSKQASRGCTLGPPCRPIAQLMGDGDQRAGPRVSSPVLCGLGAGARSYGG